jgi:hypothetical protein
MVKLQVLGNNSNTVNNIKNLTQGVNDQHSKIYRTPSDGNSSHDLSGQVS